MDGWVDRWMGGCCEKEPEKRREHSLMVLQREIEIEDKTLGFSRFLGGEISKTKLNISYQS